MYTSYNEVIFEIHLRGNFFFVEKDFHWQLTCFVCKKTKYKNLKHQKYVKEKKLEQETQKDPKNSVKNFS
jgi:hypothetical protein